VVSGGYNWLFSGVMGCRDVPAVCQFRQRKSRESVFALTGWGEKGARERFVGVSLVLWSVGFGLRGCCATRVHETATLLELVLAVALAPRNHSGGCAGTQVAGRATESDG